MNIEHITMGTVTQYPNRKDVASDNAPEKPIMGQEKLFTKKEMHEIGIIHPNMDDQGVVNAFRNLRTSLLAKMENYNSCLMVSSVSKGGGASFTAYNLAAAFTFDHQKTAILIDCNFNNPTLATRLKVDCQYGLKDFISGNVNDVSKIVYPTGVPRLRLIPGGSSDTDMVEFFTGQKMYSFLNEVRSRYANRIIILDAPPVLESADTKILAELADYLLLVVPYKGATPNVITKTLSSFDQNKIVGMVLNN